MHAKPTPFADAMGAWYIPWCAGVSILGAWAFAFVIQ